MRGVIMVHLPPGLSEASMKSAIIIDLPPGLLRRKGASLVCPPPGLSGMERERDVVMTPRSLFFIAGDERVFPLLPDLLISD
jgi:hypothetical protein